MYLKAKGSKARENLKSYTMEVDEMLSKIIILMMKKSFIPFSENINLKSKIAQKYHCILKCLPVLLLLQPYVKSIFYSLHFKKMNILYPCSTSKGRLDDFTIIQWEETNL